MTESQSDLLQYQWNLLNWIKKIILDKEGMCDFLLDIVDSMNRVESGMSVTNKDMQTYLMNLTLIRQA